MQTLYYKNKVFKVVQETRSLVTLRDLAGNEMIFEKDAVMRYLSAKKPVKHVSKLRPKTPENKKRMSIKEFLKLREQILAQKKKKRKKKKVQSTTELTLFDNIGGGT